MKSSRKMYYPIDNISKSLYDRKYEQRSYAYVLSHLHKLHDVNRTRFLLLHEV